MGNNSGSQNLVLRMLFSIGITIILCLSLTGAATQLLLSEIIGEGGTEVLITTILFLSTMAGNMLMCTYNNKQPVLVSAINIVCVMAIVIISSLSMEGVFENVLFRLGAVMAGTGVSCVLCLKMRSKPKRKKKHYR